MNLLRLGATFSLLAFLLSAQGVTERIAPGGVYGSRISADGSRVLFGVGADLRLYAVTTGQTTIPIAPPGGGPPDAPIDYWGLSGNGQFIVFTTGATNLGLANGGFGQTYVLDLQTGQLEIVSKSSAGVLADATSGEPGISDDGRFVAFHSAASNLVPNDTNATFDVFLHDRITQVTTRVSINGSTQSTLPCTAPRISGDGNWICYRTDNIQLFQNYCQYPLYHRPTGSTTCGAGGASYVQDISRHGERIAFTFSFSQYTYVLNLTNSTQTIESVLPNGTFVHALGLLSPDGGFLSFDFALLNEASVMVKRRFLRDLTAGVTHMIGVDSGGAVHDDACFYLPPGYQQLACNGTPGDLGDYARHVTFTSENASLAPGPATGPNLYVHHRTPHLGAPAAVPTGTTAALALSASEHPGKGYVVGLSTGYTPGILVDWRWAPLVWDDLLVYSLTPGAPLLANFQGALGPAGNGAASIQIPAIPGLSGASFYASFAVLDATAASGLAAFSNAAKIIVSN